MTGRAEARRTVTYVATAEPTSWAKARGVEVDRVSDDLAAYLADATNVLGIPVGTDADITAIPQELEVLPGLPMAGDYSVLGSFFCESTGMHIVLGRKVNQDGQIVYVVGQVDEIRPDVPLRGTQFVAKYLARKIWAIHVDESPEYPRKCVCQVYEATSESDLDDHVSAMMHVDDGQSHG
jgi:hypothetical protein